jgi:hypothetical protein
MVNAFDIVSIYVQEALEGMPVKTNAHKGGTIIARYAQQYGPTDKSIWIESNVPNPMYKKMIRVQLEEERTVGIDREAWDRESHPDFGEGSWVMHFRELYRAFDISNPNFSTEFIPELRRAVKGHIFGDWKK